MSVQTDFEKEFETEEYEMLILVQASCGGAVCIKDMLKPSVDFLASIDLRTGQLFHEKGRVEWLIKEDNKRKEWGYELGSFVLDREFSWFQGIVNWNGAEANVYLEIDEEDGDTAEQAMKVLKRIVDNLVDNDTKYREFAAQELTELANEWMNESSEVDAEEITQETFAKRMEISEITVNPDGSLSLLDHDDDMFWGHVIEIEVESNGEIISANIAG